MLLHLWLGRRVVRLGWWSSRKPGQLRTSKPHTTPDTAILEKTMYKSWSRRLPKYGLDPPQLIKNLTTMLLPSDVRWHFVGTLQSNKLRDLATLPNLYAIETLDDAKKASKLDSIVSACRRVEKLNVFIQVNTSEEGQKGGVRPRDAPDLALHIVNNCPRLNLMGLMTIGSHQASTGQDDVNPDFSRLVECKDLVASALQRPSEHIELSMGMSQDYLAAIKQGSTSVRVGSAVFGLRTYNK